MFYRLRMNSAMVSLGVAPSAFNPEYRRLATLFGKTAGNTPQEAALIVISKLHLGRCTPVDSALVTSWIRRRKLNPQKEDVRTALGALSLWELIALRS